MIRPQPASWRDTAFTLALCFGPAVVILGVVLFFGFAVGGRIR